MKFSQIIFGALLTLLVYSCIGDDIIFDTVAENVRITSRVDSLAVGDDFQFEAIFVNNIGIEEPMTIAWSSSDEAILAIDQNGLASGISKGDVMVTATVDLATKTITDTWPLAVADNTVISDPESRTGQLRTTSSYLLEGDFELKPDGNNLTLVLSDDYRASSNLPGLYVYLTNNPNSVNGAYEIGMVTEFSGTHSYTIPGDEVGLNQYSHLLYFCKPFGVKVGDGEFDN
ncbi:MAG TPA: Ig-like domain-containing protein [Saprospiraceae bacterium]|nr:Ig-like domain-containing protein [Saprospiraceae bacterium]HMQ83989.1 Ig-like domain-containing protein [Saprospiraceae bacterium]